MDREDYKIFARSVFIIRTSCAIIPTFNFIYTIILLCSDIPVPEFKQAVALFLSSTVITGWVLTPICSLSSSRIVGIVCTGSSFVLSAAALALVCVRWRQALETADEWSVPRNVDLSLIPADADPNLWKLVRNRQYGIGVIVGAALDLAINTICALIVWGAAGWMTIGEWKKQAKKDEEAAQQGGQRA